jgi:hypothetical protein
LVFTKCPRTIARRERELNLPVNRRNQRVLRYSMEVVVLLCAMGWEMDRKEATRLNLVPDVVLALAAKHAVVLGRKPEPREEPLQPVLLGDSDDERALIHAWNDSTKGPMLREIIRLMSA